MHSCVMMHTNLHIKNGNSTIGGVNLIDKKHNYTSNILRHAQKTNFKPRLLCHKYVYC
jgi:hypothetical protein